MWENSWLDLKNHRFPYQTQNVGVSSLGNYEQLFVVVFIGFLPGMKMKATEYKEERNERSSVKQMCIALGGRTEKHNPGWSDFQSFRRILVEWNKSRDASFCWTSFGSNLCVWTDSKGRNWETMASILCIVSMGVKHYLNSDSAPMKWTIYIIIGTFLKWIIKFTLVSIYHVSRL